MREAQVQCETCFCVPDVKSSNRFALEPIQSLQLTHRGDEHKLVYRLTYNDDVAAGQLAVFQGASDEHI